MLGGEPKDMCWEVSQKTCVGAMSQKTCVGVMSPEIYVKVASPEISRNHRENHPLPTAGRKAPHHILLSLSDIPSL